MEVDYQRYAEGEALLGWVNSEADCHASSKRGGGGSPPITTEKVGEPPTPLLDFDWAAWLLMLGKRIGALLDERGHEVGHFKMSVTANGQRHRVHQVMGGEEIVLESSEKRGRGGSPRIEVEKVGEPPTPLFLVNLRAEGDAIALEGLVAQAIAEQNDVKVTFRQQAAFQPGEPVPVHRIASPLPKSIHGRAERRCSAQAIR